MTARRAIAVYCGARDGVDPVHRQAVEALGRIIAESGRRLVYGGGRVGLMGVVADAAIAAGGEVIGVIPTAMVDRELAHPGVTLETVTTMHGRKARMAELADAFIAAPGGFGTLDEIFEAITWTQLGIQSKPVGFLDVQGYWSQLLGQMVTMDAAGFADSRHCAAIVAAEDPSVLLDRLDNTCVPAPRAEVGPGIVA